MEFHSTERTEFPQYKIEEWIWPPQQNCCQHDEKNVLIERIEINSQP